MFFAKFLTKYTPPSPDMSKRWSKLVYQTARTGLILSIAVFALHFTLMLPIFRINRIIQAEHMTHVSGHAYLVKIRHLESERFGNLPLLNFVGDNLNNPQASSLAFFENETRLTLSHTPHEDISEQGKGRFCHWEDWLVFSASDNSNPQENGRTYHFSANLGFSSGTLSFFQNLFIISLLLFLNRGSPRRLWKAFTAALEGFSRPPVTSLPHIPVFIQSISILLGLACAWVMLFLFPCLPTGTTATYIISGLYLIPLLVFAAVWHPKQQVWLIPFLLFSAIILFHFPLLDNWRGLPSESGLFLPYLDSFGYYSGALELVDSGHLNIWNQRRPITASLAALRFGLAGGDLKIALALQTSFLVLAVLFAARKIAIRFGLPAATLLVLVCLRFSAPYTPTCLSESTGLLMGALALAFLWHGLENQSPKWFAFGIFNLTLGLLARAGTFFVLPALLAWAFLWHKGRKRLTWSISIIVGILCGVLVNWLYLHILGTGENLANSNFAHTLYGMSIGGKGWSQTLVDHPELTAETPENIQKMYDLAFTNILAQPSLILHHLWKQVVAAPHFLLHIAGKDLFHASSLGVLFTLALFRERKGGFLVAILLGIFASAPILMQDGGVRVFATSIPFLALLPATAVYILQDVLKKSSIRHSPDQPSPTHATYTDTFVCCALLAFLAVPFCFTGGQGRLQNLRDETTLCPQNQTAVPFMTEHATILRVYPNNALPVSLAPDIREDTFQQGWQDNATKLNPESLKPPFSILSVLYRKEVPLYAIIHQAWHPQKGKKYTLCVESDDIPPPFNFNVGTAIPVRAIHEMER